MKIHQNNMLLLCLLLISKVSSQAATSIQSFIKEALMGPLQPCVEHFILNSRDDIDFSYVLHDSTMTAFTNISALSTASFVQFPLHCINYITVLLNQEEFVKFLYEAEAAKGFRDQDHLIVLCDNKTQIETSHPVLHTIINTYYVIPKNMRKSTLSKVFRQIKKQRNRPKNSHIILYQNCATKFSGKNNSSTKMFSIYKYCHFCQRKRIQLFSLWTSRCGFLRKDWFSAGIADFHGLTLQVGTLVYEPYVFERESSQGLNQRLGGAEINLIHHVAKYLNFYPNFSFAPDGFWGVIIDGEWNGLMGLVLNGTIDIAASAMLQTPDRYNSTDFTFPFDFGSMSYVIAFPKVTYDWYSLLKPFQPYVWLLLIVTLFMSSILFSLFLRATMESEKWRSEDVVRNGINQSRIESPLFYCIRTMFQQPSEIRVNGDMGDPLKLYGSVWLIFCIVVGTFYQSQLISRLVTPSKIKVPNTLEQLLESSYVKKKYFWRDGSDELIQASPGPLFTELKRQIIWLEDYPEVVWPQDIFKEVIEDHVAYIEITLDLKILIASYPEYHLYINKIPFLESGHAWVLRKETVYRNALSNGILNACGFGLMQKWLKEEEQKQERSLKASNHTLSYRNSEGPVISLEHLQTPFYFLLIGWAISIIEFMMEQLVYKSWKEAIGSRCNEKIKGKGKERERKEEALNN